MTIDYQWAKINAIIMKVYVILDILSIKTEIKKRNLKQKKRTRTNNQATKSWSSQVICL